MTAKLSIRCPYKKETGEIGQRILMFVYFREKDDDNKIQNAARILTKKRIQRIRAVEIFSGLLDAADEKRADKIRHTESLFLVTREEASSIELKSADIADELKNWQIHLDGNTGEDPKFLATLKLKTRSRCSLLPSNRDTVHLDFDFAKPTGDLTSENKLNCLKKLTSNYDGLEFGSAQPKPLTDIYNKFEEVTGFPDNLPRVLDFDHFAPDANGSRKPGGKSFWEVKISNIEVGGVGINNPKFGLNVGYRKDKANNEWWGNKENNATKLFPLNIAPVGVYRGENFDLEMRLTYPSQILDEWILNKPDKDVKSIWKMKVNSIYDKSFENNLDFTPLAVWNRFIAERHFQSLRMVKDSNPGSVVPYFFPESYVYDESLKSRVWTSSYDVTDKTPFGDDDLEEEQFDFVLRNIGIKSDDKTSPLQPLMIDVELRNFLDRDEKPIRRKFLLSDYALACGAEDNFTDEVLFRLTIQDTVIEPEKETTLKSRVGALNLHFTEPWGETENVEPFRHEIVGMLTGGLRGVNELDFSEFDNRLIDRLEEAILNRCNPSVETEIPLLLDGLSPGGQDPLPQEIADKTERFPETIIIPVSDTFQIAGAEAVQDDPGFIKGKFVLVANESNRAQENQQFALRIEKFEKTLTNQSSPPISFIVIDQHPFLVAKVSANINFADEVGNWDDAESFWELADEGKSFELILPPQVVGEEFIKDYENFPKHPDSTSKPDEPFRIRYKFSPPAVFNLFRSNERQNFTEAPWNIRRLLGYIKGKERGAEVEQLEYELLFGLTTTVKNDFLRLAELNARLGHLPPQLREKSPLRIDGFVEKSHEKICDEFLIEYDKLRRRFRNQKSLLQSRLALLYPFSVAQKARFLTLDNGVTFRFRTTREVVHPIDETISNKTFKRLDEGGMRGGVDQGFESGNIHTEVINSETSSSGKIIAPSFTALGGSGYQRASFARDKSTIYSNTFLGRTFFYSLERIGRIGVLWNRAKHVIVYERSVADTEQFDDKKKIWRKIPVVRKVAEYVEILQPERSYPEFGEALKVRGFVLGSKFEPEARIAVDSKWGRDISGGWVVPLHNPAAEKDKPTVYPKPNIHLKIATAEETGKAQTWGRITNPEDLYFYTSTNPQDDDRTDEWAAVPEIDYPLENIPKPPDKIETHVKGSMDATLPDPPRTEGGYEPFTFHLDTNGQTADLLADRLKSSVEAVIENVSMARRKMEEFKFDASNVFRSNLKTILDAKGKDYQNEVEKQLNQRLSNLIDPTVNDLKKHIEDLQNDINLKLEPFNELYKNLKIDTDAQNLTTTKFFQKAQEDLENKWKNAWSQTREKVLKGITESNRVEEARDFLFDLKRQIAAAEFALNETRMKLQKAFAEIERWTKDFEPLPNDSIKNELQTEIRKVRNRLESEVKKIIAEVDNLIISEQDKIKLKKERVIAAAIAELTRWHKFLNDLRTQIERLIPDFWQGVDIVANELIDKLVIPILTDAQTVQTWLDEVEGLFRKYEVWLKDLQTKVGNSFKVIDDKAKELEEVLKARIKNIEDLEKETIENIKSKIGATIKDIEDKFNGEFFTPAKTKLQELNSEIDKIHGEIDKVTLTAQKEIETAAAIAKKIAEKLQADLTDETRRAVQNATEALMGNATKILAPFEKKLRDEVRRIDLSGDLEKAKAVGERTLRLVRAYGEAPIAQAMKLNRERLAYYYGETKKAENGILGELKDSIGFTPATVLMNRVGRELENLDLKTLGTRLPSKELVEKFVANNLPQFDLKDILPDFAGMKLEKFFSGVKIPQGVKDAVNVAHGIDKQTGRAWAKCDVVMPLDKPVSLFNFGAVEVRLVKAHFEAHTSMSADLMNPDRIEKHAEGAITADWHLLILGQIVLTLEKSTLRFDKNGKLKFEMQPASIKLAAALQFVSDLVRTFSPGKKSGLSFELVMQGMLPVGARAVLNLPLPPLQTGAFAISHIALRSRFEVAAPGGKFYVGVGLSLSSKERPFTLTILCLGGGGWLDVLATYRPFEESNKLQTRLSIGLAAGADFTFDIGVAAGTVYFLISLYAEYTVGGGNSNLKIALRLSMGGEVSILGIVSVNLSLVLEASYESGGTLKCRGELKVSIEICWCFTLEVEQEVEFVLAGSGGGNNGNQLNSMAANNEVEAAVENYINSYGE